MTSSSTSLAALSIAIREQRVSAGSLIEEAIAAHETRGEKLHAYKTWCGERAVKQARAADALLATGVDLGPLMGLPVSVKDLYGVPGLPVFAGTNEALPSHWTNAGPVVQRLLSQLGIVMGKSHTVEFAFGGLGINAHWGTPVNPWSDASGVRVPGGSSSGAGVSLVEGSALVALGTDTAGSVRIPAAFTGQAGLKITQGRWSSSGIVPLSTSLDTPGLLCRTVADLAYAFAALDPLDKGETQARSLLGMRIGVPTTIFFDDADRSVAARIEETLLQLERRGAILVPVEVPGCAEVLDIFRQGGLAAPELRAFLDRHFPERIARLDPVVRLRVEGADSVSSAEYLRRRTELSLQGKRAEAVFGMCDLVMTPTVAISPPRVSDIQQTADYARANMLALRNTAIANLFGWCALTLPAGPDAFGLPVGLQLMAPPMREESLLSAGRAIEEAIGTCASLMGKPAHFI